MKVLPDREQQNSDGELLALIAARCEGTATPDQWERLSDRLIEDPAAADLYVAHMTLHAGLTWLSNQSDSRGLFSSQGASPHRLLSSRLKASYFYVAVTMVLVAVGMGWYFLPRQTNRTTLAWVETKEDNLNKRPVGRGDHVRQGQGESYLTFLNGVSVTLTGTSDLEIIDSMNVLLHTGQIQVDVGPDGRGFTVKTPSTDVIDLGTVFGVSITDETETNVVVFSGEVQLGNKSDGKSSRPSLLQGEAIRVNTAGEHSLVREIWMEPDGSHWSTEKLQTSQSPIAAVSDNRRGADCSKFYTIVPGGFGEDAVAFGDRHHEWNSLPGIPLPVELEKADYIRTFNDTKFEDPLKIILTLSMPANVYILMDERFDPPEWLTADYEKTDFRLGLDLKNRDTISNSPPPPPGAFAHRYLGRGPGMSVDVPFVVWKRTFTRAEDIPLGRNGTPPQTLRDKGAGSMYGIVVTPLRQQQNF